MHSNILGYTEVYCNMLKWDIVKYTIFHCDILGYTKVYSNMLIIGYAHSSSL